MSAARQAHGGTNPGPKLDLHYWEIIRTKAIYIGDAIPVMPEEVKGMAS